MKNVFLDFLQYEGLYKKIQITEENIETLDKENTIIKEQTPTEGIKVNKENKIFVKY